MANLTSITNKYNPGGGSSVTPVVTSIPDGLLPRYKDAFIPSFLAPFAIQPHNYQKRRSWVTESRKGIYLTDGKIEAHLKGKYYIGPVAKTHTKSIVIDLDTGEDDCSLDRRTEQVCNALADAAPLMFSTPRGGRHLHFMLEQPAWSERATTFAHDRLDEAGIDRKAGVVEVFPAGAKALRAPLGRGCYMLDICSFSPVRPDRVANLEALNELLETRRYDTLEIPADYGATRTPEKPQSASRRPVGASENAYMMRVDHWLREGLTGPSQRNQAFLDLCWYMRVVQGFDEQRAVAELWAWIVQYHNGYSEEYNRSPRQVYRKVRNVVKHCDPGKTSDWAATRPRDTGRTTEEFEGAVQIYVTLAALDDQEKTFLIDLLRYAHRRGQKTPDGTKLDVQIPSRTLQSFNRRYGRLLPGLLEQGYMDRSKNYGANIRRCNTYRLPLLVV